MYYVYVLENAKGRHYIGCCQDLTERLKQHNGNCVTSTKNKGPYKVVYKETFDSHTEARKRENQIKRYKGNSVFKRLINRSVPIV